MTVSDLQGNSLIAGLFKMRCLYTAVQ